MAIDRIQFAIQHAEKYAPHTDHLREAGLQLLDALDRLQSAERRFSGAFARRLRMIGSGRSIRRPTSVLEGNHELGRSSDRYHSGRSARKERAPEPWRHDDRRDRRGCGSKAVSDIEYISAIDGCGRSRQVLGHDYHALRHKAAVDIPCVRIDTKLRFDRRDLDRYIDRAKREGV